MLIDVVLNLYIEFAIRGILKYFKPNVCHVGEPIMRFQVENSFSFTTLQLLFATFVFNQFSLSSNSRCSPESWVNRAANLQIGFWSEPSYIDVVKTFGIRVYEMFHFHISMSFLE